MTKLRCFLQLLATSTSREEKETGYREILFTLKNKDGPGLKVTGPEKLAWITT